MKKREFLDIVSKFSREEFRDYLYKSPNKKLKLLDVVTIIGDNKSKFNKISNK